MLRSKAVSIACGLLVAGAMHVAAQQNGTWTNTAPAGNWGDANNWLDHIVADGFGSVADFSTLDLPLGPLQQAQTNIVLRTTNVVTVPNIVPTNYVVTLTQNTTNGGLVFGDRDNAGTPGNWVINAAVDPGTGLPSVFVLKGTNNAFVMNMTNLTKAVTNWITITTNTSGVTVTNVGTANVVGGDAGVFVQLVDALAEDGVTPIPSGFVKTGPGVLTLYPTNAGVALQSTYSGGTIISNGTVRLGGSAGNCTNANAYSLGSGPVTFYGGVLALYASDRNTVSANFNVGLLANPLVVPAGQTGTLLMPGYQLPAVSSPLTGSGTFNLQVNYVRDDVNGDWSAFTGNLNVYARSGGCDFRIGSTATAGFPNARLNLTNNPAAVTATVTMYSRGTAGTVVPIGELRGERVATITAGTGSGAGQAYGMVLRVGGLNTDATYAGNFAGGTAGGGLGIIKEGSGTWTWAGTNIVQWGDTTVSGGTLQIGDGGTSGSLGWSTNVINDSVLAFNRLGTLTVTNLLSGAGLFVQRGGGTLVLAPTPGTNAYTGKTIVTNGALSLVAEAALGPNPGTFTADSLTLGAGALLNANASLTLGDANRGITLGTGGGAFGATSSNLLTVAGIVAGNGSLTVTNAGTVALTGANSYSGKTIIRSGTLALATEGPLGKAPSVATADQLTLNGGTLRATATFSIDDSNRGMTVQAGGGAIAPDEGAVLTLAEPVVGPGTLTKTGVGKLTLQGVDNRTGNTIVSQGTLALGNAGSLVASPLISVAAGATFDVSASGIVLANGQTLGGSGSVVGNVTVGSGATVSAGVSVGNLTFANNLTLNGGTNLVEISSTANDTLTVLGDLTLSGLSTIKLSLLGSLPVGTYPLIKYGGTLSGTAANLTLAGYPLSRLVPSLVVNPATKSIDLVLTGTAATVLWVGGANANAWDVAITTNWLNGSALDVFFGGDEVTFNDSGAANSSVQLIGALGPGQVTVDAAADYVFGGNGKLTGPTGLRKLNSGKLSLLTVNDYFGPTLIAAGSVQVGDGVTAGSLGAGAVTNLAALNFNPPSVSTNVASISGSGNITKQGTGTLVLAADNAYSGATVISAGILQVGAGGGSGSLGSSSVANQGSLVFNRTGSVTNGAIGGSGSLIVQGGGRVALSADNSYSGATVVNGAALQVGIGGTAGTLGTAGAVTLTNNGSLAFARSDSVTNTVVVTGAGNLVQNGPGFLTLISSNSYSGQTVINGGVLQVGDGTLLGTLGSGILVTNNGTLVFNSPINLTNTSVISGAGSLVQLGKGTLTLSPNGVSSYAGGTVISNSTIALFGPAAGNPTANNYGLGTGVVTLLDGTLSLYGFGLNDNTATFGQLTNTLLIPANRTGTLLTPPRYTMSGPLIGGGVLNYTAVYVRGDISGDWSAFTGQINVLTSTNVPTNPGSGEFRVAATTGFGHASMDLGLGASLYSTVTPAADGTTAIDIGELSGATNAWVGGSSAASGRTTSWRVGGKNTSATYAGTLANSSVSGNASFTGIIKVGTGTWTLSGINTYSGPTTISNGVLALAGTAGLTNSGTITVVAPGMLDVTGRQDGTLWVGSDASQTLSGSGTVRGAVNVSLNGVLAPGLTTGVGTLTVTEKLLVDTTINMKLDHVGSALCDSVVCPDITVQSATLNVTQVGTNDLQTGDTFRLFSRPVSGFASINLPTQNYDSSITYVWTNRLALDGTIQLLSGATPTVNTTPTNLLATVKAGQLTLSWPADHTGWRLETNSVSVVDTNSWFTLPGSESTNQVILAIEPTKASVFYRLVYP